MANTPETIAKAGIEVSLEGVKEAEKKFDQAVEKMDGQKVAVNLDITGIENSIKAIQGMVQKMEKSFDGDFKFSGMQKGLDDLKQNIKSVTDNLSKMTYTTKDDRSFLAVQVGNLGKLNKMADAFVENIDKITNPSGSNTQFDSLLKTLEDMRDIVFSINEGMNFDKIRPTNVVANDIENYTKELNSLAESEEYAKNRLEELQRVLQSSGTRKKARDIFEMGDSEDVELSNRALKAMREYIQLGGDLSNIKISGYASHTESFADIFKILESEGKIQVDTSDIDNSIQRSAQLREELEKLQEELKAAKTRADRSINVGFDEDALNRMTSSIADAAGKMSVAFPENFTFGMSEDNLSAIIDKLDQIIKAVDKITNKLAEGVNVASVERVNTVLNEVAENANKADYALDEVTDGTEALEKKAEALEHIAEVEKKVADNSPTTPNQSPISSADSIAKSIKDQDELNSSISESSKALIEEQKATGEVVIAFRGLEGSMDGFISKTDRAMTFFTDSPYLARQYANELGGVYQANVALGNSLRIDGQGRDWNFIEYLGDGTDEASKKITELRKTIDSLQDQLNTNPNAINTGLDGRAEINRGDYSYMVQMYGAMGTEYESYIEAVEKGNLIELQQDETVKKLMTDLYEAEKAYRAISDARDNVYGTHTTNEFGELAKANGYDSVVFDNIKDSFDYLSRLTQVGIIFDDSQIESVKIVNEQLDQLINKLDRIKGSGYNLPHYEQQNETAVSSPENVENIKAEEAAATALTEAKEKLIQTEKEEKGASQDDSQVPELTAEEKAMAKLQEALLQTTLAVRNKNSAFKDEAQIVASSVGLELGKLDELYNALVKVGAAVKELSDIPVKIDINAESIKDFDPSKFEAISNLKEKLTGINTDDIKALAESLNAFNKKTLGDNLTAIASGILDLRESLDGFNSGDTLSGLNELLSKTDELKSLATILSSSKKEIKEAIKMAEESKKKSSSADNISPSNNSSQKLKDFYIELHPTLSEKDWDEAVTRAKERILKKIGSGFDANLGDNIEGVASFDNPTSLKYFEAMNEEYEKLGYTLKNIRINEGGTTLADIVKIDNSAITNLEEARKILFDIADAKKEASNGKKANESKVSNTDNYNGVDKGLSSLVAKISGVDASGYMSETRKSIELIQKELEDCDNIITKISNKEVVSDDEVKRVEKLKDDFAKIDLKDKNGILANQNSVTKLIANIRSYMERNSGMSKQFKNELQGIIDNLEKAGEVSKEFGNNSTIAFNKTRGAVAAAGQETKSFADMFTHRVKSMSASALAMYFSFYDIIRYVREAYSTINELDTALVDLRKTTSMTANQLDEFYGSANDVAKQMGVTTEEIINQASAWSRLGFSTKEQAETMASVSSQFAAISPDMNVDEATDGLVSVMKAFNIDADDALDGIASKINIIGNTAATTNGEIVDMLQRSSAAMKEANNSLDDTIALETAAVEITRNAESTGTAFKTKFLQNCLYVQKCA